MPNAPTIANTSCLIALDACGRLGVLEQVYGQLLIPVAVAHEWGKARPPWIVVHAVQNQALVHILQLALGPGEAEAIALAQELSAARIVLDDKKARRIANALGLPVTGTIAVLLRAKEKRVIPSVGDAIQDLIRAGFRLSSALIAQAFSLAGE